MSTTNVCLSSFKSQCSEISLRMSVFFDCSSTKRFLQTILDKRKNTFQKKKIFIALNFNLMWFYGKIKEVARKKFLFTSYCIFFLVASVFFQLFLNKPGFANKFKIIYWLSIKNFFKKYWFFFILKNLRLYL